MENNLNKISIKYQGLNNLTKKQIELLAYRLKRELVVIQQCDIYYLAIYGIAASRIYYGRYSNIYGQPIRIINK